MQVCDWWSLKHSHTPTHTQKTSVIWTAVALIPLFSINVDKVRISASNQHQITAFHKVHNIQFLHLWKGTHSTINNNVHTASLFSECPISCNAAGMKVLILILFIDLCPSPSARVLEKKPQHNRPSRDIKYAYSMYSYVQTMPYISCIHLYALQNVHCLFAMLSAVKLTTRKMAVCV